MPFITSANGVTRQLYDPPPSPDHAYISGRGWVTQSEVPRPSPDCVWVPPTGWVLNIDWDQRRREGHLTPEIDPLILRASNRPSSEHIWDRDSREWVHRDLMPYHRLPRSERRRRGAPGQRRCRLCGETGHNRRTCWQRPADESLDDYGDLRRSTTPPQTSQRKTLPKHIAQQIAKTTEVSCQICLSDLDENTLVLSMCGHNFCETCIQDSRLDKCGVCRQDL